MKDHAISYLMKDCPALRVSLGIDVGSLEEKLVNDIILPPICSTVEQSLTKNSSSFNIWALTQKLELAIETFEVHK